MEVRATESALYEEIGRLHIANRAKDQHLANLTAENARLRSDVDAMASAADPQPAATDKPEPGNT